MRLGVYVPLLAIGLGGYLGGHLLTARTLDVTVGEVAASTREGVVRDRTATVIATDKGDFGLVGLPGYGDVDEMKAALRPGQRVRVTVIDWAHGPLIAAVTGRDALGSIIEVAP
ncbi:MAG: hypothetical protein AAF371_13930 [Pseudomonadota bacterium]